MRTTTYEISAKLAPKFAAALVDQSRWFECTPLPDDVFEFKFKEEAARGINALLGLIIRNEEN